MTFSRNDMAEDALIEISKAQRAQHREVAPVTSLDKNPKLLATALMLAAWTVTIDLEIRK